MNLETHLFSDAPVLDSANLEYPFDLDRHARG
jgi:hypothetical protein